MRVDGTEGGNFEFSKIVETEAVQTLDLESRYRIVCIYLLLRLSGRALRDACESVLDVYAWQIEQKVSLPVTPEPRRHSVGLVRKVEREPFTIDID